MIGHKVWQTLARHHKDTYGTLRRRREVFAVQGIFDDRIIEQFDAEDFEGVANTLNHLKPTVIINCIGITKRKTEASNLKLMYEVNARFPHNLSLWASRNGARVIHFSTDCVFDGADGNYHERSVVTAPDMYGQTKYFGEIDYDHCLTIRSSMIGRELEHDSELLEWFLAQRGKRISGFKRAIYSGVTTTVMSGMVQRIIWEFPKLNGRYQIAGPAISKHDLLVQLKEAFNYDVEITPDDRFHCDRSMQSEKFRQATGITAPTWKEMIAGLVEERGFYDRMRQQSPNGAHQGTKPGKVPTLNV